MLLTRPPLPLRGARLACVRPAASVRSEPGSNSQVESAEALSLTSNLRTSVSPAITAEKISLYIMCQVIRRQRDPQVVKLTPTSSVGHLAVTPLVGRYARRLTPMRPNRPHIPSYSQFSKSADTKHAAHQNFWRTCRLASRLSLRWSSPPLPSLPFRVSASLLLR